MVEGADSVGGLEEVATRGLLLRLKIHPEEGGSTQFVHGRSRMTIGPRIPTMPERSKSGFNQPGRYCLHQARSAMR